MTRRRLWLASVATAATLAPSAALACPQCAGQSGGIGVIVLLGAMILVPFGVAWAVLRVIRNV